MISMRREAGGYDGDRGISGALYIVVAYTHTYILFIY